MVHIPVAERIAALKKAIEDKKLPERDWAFAGSLIENARYRPLSIKQAEWVDILLKRAEPAPPARVICDFSGVYALFQRAKEHLQHPKIRLQINGQEITLYLSGPNSRVPNVVNVTRGPFGTPNNWLGRVTADGVWEPSRDVGDAAKPVTKLLKALGKDPEAVAAEYGKLMGRCCFCGRGLDDARSTEVGYGPVCAKNYGLNWGKQRRAA